MAGRRRLPWAREPEGEAPAAQAPAAPAPRPPAPPHHWLTLLVGRPGPAGPLPVPDARVVVRPFPRGASRPGEPMARATTGVEGTVALHLPAGRYAVSARHGGEGRVVTVTLEHAGRALLLLESLGKRVVLTVEVTGPDGEPLPEAAVEARATPGNALAGRGVTDERGVAAIHVPPGAYEVRVGGVAAKTYVEADTLLRLAAESDAPAVATPASSRYAQKARAATSYVAPFDITNVRDETLN